MPKYEKTSIEHLFCTHYAKMYRTAYSLLRDEEVSRDIVSSVFARLCEEDIEMREGGEEAYLVVCVRNACYNFVKRKRLHEKIMKLYPLDTPQVVLMSEVEEDPLVQVREFINNKLTVQSSRIFRLRYDEEKSYKEVAEECGVSISAVNKHLVEALRRLRERFKTKNF